MAEPPNLLHPRAAAKHGRDPIFAMLSRCRAAAEAGADVVNGTVGALLEDDGSLALNRTYLDALKGSPDVEFAAYSPLTGRPDFNDLLVELALGPSRASLSSAGLATRAMATPGGGGALRLTAANLAPPGGRVLMRDRHWGPYHGFLTEAGLERATWPLLGPEGEDVDVQGFQHALADLSSSQAQVLVWLNDPAHNPTGLSLQAEGRRDVLEAVVASALTCPDVGHSLMIDAAYALYANEAHGWATTVEEALEDGMLWPDNLLLLWAVSLSKSHTAYGARCGGLVSMHPEEEVLDRVHEAFAASGRGTWSGPPRAPQHAAVLVHGDAELGEAWSDRLEELHGLLDQRRSALISACHQAGVSLNPTHDGFFAWLEHEEPERVVEACMAHHVYLVALDGGVRIGLCAIPVGSMQRVADALAAALEA